jgi:hypothetical protein
MDPITYPNEQNFLEFLGKVNPNSLEGQRYFLELTIVTLGGQGIPPRSNTIV